MCKDKIEHTAIKTYCMEKLINGTKLMLVHYYIVKKI